MKFRSPPISREGWVYVLMLSFMLGAAILRQINLLMLLWGLLAGPLLLSWRLARIMLTRLDVRRVLPGPVSAGDLLVVRIEASNRRRRIGTWSLVVQDTIERVGSEPRETVHASALFPYVPAGKTRKSGYRGRLARRGKYRFGPLRVGSRFPFGLLNHAVVVEQPEELLVLPRLGRLSRRWRQMQQAVQAGSGRGHRRRGSQDGDFYGLREWRADDSRRSIHWRTSARRQTLVVRQFEEERRQDFALVVDMWQPERAGPADLDNVELAVSLAATMAADLCRQGGGELTLATTCDPARIVHGATSPALLCEAMEMLALADASPHLGLQSTVAEVAAAIKPGTRLVVIAPRAWNLAEALPAPSPTADARQASLLQRAVTIDTSREELTQFFEIDLDQAP